MTTETVFTPDDEEFEQQCELCGIVIRAVDVLAAVDGTPT